MLRCYALINQNYKSGILEMWIGRNGDRCSPKCSSKPSLDTSSISCVFAYRLLICRKNNQIDCLNPLKYLFRIEELREKYVKLGIEEQRRLNKAKERRVKEIEEKFEVMRKEMGLRTDDVCPLVFLG